MNFAVLPAERMPFSAKTQTAAMTVMTAAADILAESLFTADRFVELSGYPAARFNFCKNSKKKSEAPYLSFVL